MMQFEVIRDAIRRLLADKAAGEFCVIGAQKSAKAAESVADKSRLIEVYYNRGEFPKSGGGITGPNRHDATFRIDLTASKATEGDVSTIVNEESTAAQMAQALADMKESGLLADNSLDELFAAVYQILMDARSEDLGLEVGEVSSRWVTQLVKDEPIKTGSYTILTGSALLTCTVSEPVTGYKAVPVAPILSTDLELESDTAGKAGVRVEGETL
jgi:hypothetical protein